MFTLRYFSFDDPVTGKTTKGYGYSFSKSIQNVVVKNAAILKNEIVEQTRENVPQYSNVKELSQKEFDALDVSGESLLSQLSRERNFLRLQKLERKLNIEFVPVSPAVLVKAFSKVL